MVFKTYNTKEKTNVSEEYYVCECGHIDIIHSVIHDLLDHRIPVELRNDSPCSWCECPKYIFQIKTNVDGWHDILRERRDQWRIKKENWDKNIDEEIGI